MMMMICWVLSLASLSHYKGVEPIVGFSYLSGGLLLCLDLQWLFWNHRFEGPINGKVDLDLWDKVSMLNLSLCGPWPLLLHLTYYLILYSVQTPYPLCDVSWLLVPSQAFPTISAFGLLLETNAESFNNSCSVLWFRHLEDQWRQWWCPYLQTPIPVYQRAILKCLKWPKTMKRTSCWMPLCSLLKCCTLGWIFFPL